MSRFSPLESHSSLETLELKISPSSVGVVAAPVVATIQSAPDDDPLPDPEPDPIPYPGDGPPIEYPLLPPVGPAGPGA
jgi:hypothetical protein